MAGATTLSRGDRLIDQWRVRTRAERVAIVVVAGLIVTAVAWLLIWLPLERGIDRLSRELAAMRSTLADARQQADAMAAIERRSPPPTRDSRASLDAALAHSGLKASAIDRPAEDRIRVTIDAVAFDDLAALLETLQRDGALHVVDLTATARVEPAMVRADFTLAR